MRPPAAFSGGGVPRRMLPTYQAATGSKSRHADGESRHFARRQHERSTRLLEPRGEAAGADFVEHGDRRHVQRKLQGTAHRHRALEIEVEILRRIAAETD